MVFTKGSKRKPKRTTVGQTPESGGLPKKNLKRQKMNGVTDKSKKEVQKKPIESMDVDDFMTSGFGDLSDSGSDGGAVIGGTPLKKTKMIKKKKMTNKEMAQNAVKSDSKHQKSQTRDHKDVVGGLKEKDPEFYKFLQSEDKDLLNFDDSSDDEVHDALGHELIEQQFSSSDENSEGEQNDDSDAEDGEKITPAAGGKRVHVTQKMIDNWSAHLKSKPSLQVIDKLVKAFQAAVQEAAGDEIDTVVQYKVEGSAMFNAVVRACLKDLPGAFSHILKLDKNEKKPPSSYKLWNQLKTSLKAYFSSLIKLVSNLAEPEVINAVLKHISQLIVYYSCLPKHTRILLKKLISIWATGEETSRVLAFISIIKLVRLQQEALLEKTLKAMYMSYVRNCKFTSPSLLPMINFMQHSLVELFALSPNLGYQYTFIYIRQLAIHLRNAMASKKKDAYQVVYNWQYIHSCGLFARVVSNLKDDENINQLIYPLVQIILGVIRLIPTARFYPLRFQCVRMLNLIASKTSLYIPVLPQLLEVYEITDFQRKVTKVNSKPLDFSCILKLSKGQTQDRAFKDGVMDQMYELILDNLSIYSHTIGFPELVIPALSQMKEFVKKCKIANFTKQVKQLIEKIESTSRTIEKRRKASSIDLTNPKSVDAWESNSLLEGTPMSKYYKQYRQLRDRELQYEISGKEEMESIDRTPVANTGQRKATKVEREEFSELFASDQDDSSDDEERFLLKEERSKKQKKKQAEESDDDIESLDSEDYDLLNKSGSEGESDDGEDKSGDKEEAVDEQETGSSDEEYAEDVVEDLELSDLDD